MTTPSEPAQLSHAEVVLYASLMDVDALEELAYIGLAPECVPTVAMRDVVDWAVAYFYRSGRTKAPSRELIVSQWGHRLEQSRIELPEEDVQVDDISAAVALLKAQHVLVEHQRLQREVAIEMAGAEPHERVAQAHKAAEVYGELSMRVRDRTGEVEGITGLRASLDRYEERAAAARVITGMSLGIDAVDEHTLGIHNGEICAWAAPPKGAKSFSATHVGKIEWERGRETVVYTLENSVEMSYDRLACQICCVDYRKYQRGDASPEDVERVREWLTANEDDLKGGLHLISPEPDRRTPQALIRHAQSLGAKSVIIDQLSHIQHPNPGRKPRHEIVAEIMAQLADLITIGRNTLPLMLNCQINREGVAAATKAGKLELQHLAESAAIERYSSWVFGLMRSETEVAAGMATLQMLASRRMDLKNWRCAWEPWYGTQHALGEVNL